LDGIVCVERIRDPMIAVVVSTTFYLHFVSFASTLATFSMVGLCWRRLSSSILSWIGGDIWLGANNIGFVVADVACGVSSAVGWRVSRGVGSGVDRLYYFVFTSSLFSHGLKRTITLMSLARMF
jgi:hypothetical protein